MPVIELAGGPTLPTPGPVAIIRPADGEPWVLSVAFAGLGQLCASPDPDAFCVFERHGRVAFVNTRTHRQTDLGIANPVHVAAALDHELLLIAELDSITAIGADGIRWTSPVLVGVDLHITRSDGDRIYFRCFDVNGIDQVRGSLDAATGEVIQTS
jgi:hypothetical protein